MASRDDLLPLKASRRGYKGLTTKYRRTALDAIKAFVEGDDPFYVESKLESWEKKLDQFRNAEDLVVCHPAADENDMDKDLDDHEDAFDRAKLKVRGFRQDFDRAREAISSGVSDISPNNSPNPGLPKLNIKRPPVLEEDTDLRSFIQWCHLWNNYANLLALSKRDRTTQVSLFWECCSPGFFQIIQHSLGIKPDTGREVDEIIRMIRDHLRSLRSVHLDMRDLLLVRQQDGQDYTSLCNVLREQADFADLANITQDKLLIALLLQAMKCEDDKMKVMERNPQTFDEARHQILELETSRHGAKGMSQAHHVFAARFKSQYRSRKDFKSVKKSSDASCKYCGRFAHPREKCPAQKSQCRTCNQKGHWDKVCRSRSLDTKVRQETKQFSSSRVGSLKLHRASSHTLSTVSNEIEIGITPVGYGGYPIRITFCADTGADISVMGVDLFTKSGLSKIVTLSDSLIEDVIGIDGTSIKQMGMFSATLSIVDISAEEIPILACHGLRDAYLSLDACKALTIIDGNFPSPKPKVASLLLPNPSHSKSLFWKDRESWISQLPNEAGPDIFKMIESKLREIYSKVFECDTLSPMTGPIVGEPLVQDSPPTRPFQVVSADLFTYGQCEYLVYSDRLSGYPLVIQYRTSPNSSLLMKDFARMFSLFGVPNVLRTDNGPQFASQSFSLFLKKWGVTWMSSSPYYPQSNGHAEVMVKSIKHLLAKTGGDFHSEDFAEGMLEFRNTPMADGLSPAQRVFGRPVRSRIPIHDELLQGDSTHDADRDVKRQSLAQTRKHHYDQSAKPLSPLSNGSVVFVQNPTTRRWDREAKIIKCYKRRYLLEFNNGHKSWRNRRFLRASFVDLPIESEILSACDGDAEPRLRRSTRSHRPPNRLGYHR